MPLPAALDEEQHACFIVRDHGGQALAYVYFENEPGRQSAVKLYERDEAALARVFSISNRRAIYQELRPARSRPIRQRTD